MFVRDWMSKEPVTLRHDQTVAEAWTLMDEINIRRMPVLNDGQMVGIVTKTDLLAHLGKGGLEAADEEDRNKHVSRVMTRDPKVVYPDSTVEDAAVLMHDHKISGLPVVDQNSGNLVGIITETDIFSAFLEIMGLLDHAPRIAWERTDAQGIMEDIQGRMPEGSVPRSIVAYYDKSNENYQVVLRVRGEDALTG